MLEIDGGKKSGSGTIVRDVIPFSALINRDVHIKNIRAKRDKPGLRPQHLRAVEAIADICNGELRGAKVGAREIWFRPGGYIKGGDFYWDIGTAGSTTMLAMALLPISLFAERTSTFIIKGGLFQDFAPSAFHMQHVLFPTLRAMGASVDLEILQPGYVPMGQGRIKMTVEPLKTLLKSLERTSQGKVEVIKGIALSSLLKERRVSHRMAEACENVLKAHGYRVEIKAIYDTKEKPAFKKPSVQPGACLAIWANTDKGCLLGSDMAGALGRTSEFIGKKTAKQLIQDLSTGATLDRHLSDQVIPYAALAEGMSRFIIPMMTDHVETRLWLVEEILGAKTEVDGNEVRIEGIGYLRE
ncbi:MAG: RNA 3'-phosphate cyclase [Nitrospirae bacterium]|nr:MAG: RNA 3'-phosphate cyclase [Nitrospirota bacterium]